MSRAFFRRSASTAAIGGLLASVVAIPFGAWAQSDAGGFLMQLRLAERFVSRSSDSTGTTDDSSTQAITDLGFSVSSETRNQALKLDVGTGYRFYDDDTTDGFEGGIIDPRATLSYSQTTRASSLTVAAGVAQIDLADATAIEAARRPDGSLSPDFATLVDGGTRRDLSFDASLSIRDDAPFGLTFGLTLDDTAYDALPTGSSLSDSSTLTLRSDARFDISPVLQANLGAFTTRTDIDDFGTLDRYGITAGAVLTRPNGAITLSTGVEDGDGGAQATLSLARSFALPQTEVSFGAGLAYTTSDDVLITTRAALTHDFGDDSQWGSFAVAAERNVTIAGRTDEDIITSLSLGTDYALSPRTNLRLAGDYVQSEDVRTAATVDLGQIGLTATYDITPDWRASAGMSAQSRSASDGDDSTSTTLSLGIARTFDLRR